MKNYKMNKLTGEKDIVPVVLLMAQNTPALLNNITYDIMLTFIGRKNPM